MMNEINVIEMKRSFYENLFVETKGKNIYLLSFWQHKHTPNTCSYEVRLIACTTNVQLFKHSNINIIIFCYSPPPPVSCVA